MNLRCITVYQFNNTENLIVDKRNTYVTPIERLLSFINAIIHNTYLNNNSVNQDYSPGQICENAI